MTILKGWYVIYVKYRHERKIYDELLNHNVEAFLPTVLAEVQWSDRKKKVQRPLFPSYVFVNIKSKLDYHTIISLDEVFSFVKFGKEFGRVSQEEINQLKFLVEGKDVSDIQTNLQLPSIGDKLRIAHGELSGLECEVYRVDNVHKVRVWLGALRQNVSATIPAYYFQSAVQA
ncbi:UpxY family transcription antiterminator [Flavobacteriaceae bacterium M23B6Z8]